MQNVLLLLFYFLLSTKKNQLHAVSRTQQPKDTLLHTFRRFLESLLRYMNFRGNVSICLFLNAELKAWISEADYVGIVLTCSGLSHFLHNLIRQIRKNHTNKALARRISYENEEDTHRCFN